MPGRNGETPSETNSTESEASGQGSPEVPSLSVGQKLLLKLPDLTRSKSASRSQESSDEPEESPSKPVVQKRPAGTKAAPKPKYSEPLEAEDPGSAEMTQAAEVSGRAESEEKPAESEEERVSSHSEDGSAPISPRPRRSTTSRPAAATRPTPASAYDNMSTNDLTGLIRKLDDKERLLSFIAAPLGAVLAIVVTIVAVHTDPALHHKGHESTGEIVADGGVGVAFALFVLAMAWFRRRSLTAFALLFLGYSVGLIGPGIPFLFLGGYLLYRAWKIQKVLTSRGVSTRPQRRPPARSPRDPKNKRDLPTKSTAARPNASKRYTPPKPPPKRPPVPKPEKAAGP